MCNNFLEVFYEAQQEIEEDRILFVSGIKEGMILHTYVYYIPQEEELYNIIDIDKEEYIDIRYLLNILQKEDANSQAWQSILNPNKYINPIYQEEVEELLVEIAKLQILKNDKDKIIPQISHIIKQIITRAIKNNASQEQEFFNQLTKTEWQVLSNILHLEFKGAAAGYITVHQLTDKYKISTPVFRSLFYKLKEYNIADVMARGVKGTYIKFNNINNIITLVDNF